jgi:lipopolysaccharide/colanic/teichoic acid biosynthesis glycosyltransferase
LKENGPVGREIRTLGPGERRLKRIFDLIAVLILLVPALPLSLVIAIMIAVDSRGPIIFRQQRLGEHGRRFWMLKFRSMLDGAEEYELEQAHLNDKGVVLLKHADDPRVTRVGKWLRRTSLSTSGV